MAAFICTCRAMGANAHWYDTVDQTGCVVHDRVSRLQFERDEALADKARLKRQVDDLADTLSLIAALVDHRKPTTGEELIASVKRVVDDRDWKHAAWARLTGDDFGKRAMKECRECHDRVSICLHAQKAQDDSFLNSLKAQAEIEELRSRLAFLEEKEKL